MQKYKSDMLMTFRKSLNDDWDGVYPFDELNCVFTVTYKDKVRMSMFKGMDSDFKIGYELSEIMETHFEKFGLPINTDSLQEIAIELVRGSKRDIEYHLEIELA